MLLVCECDTCGFVCIKIFEQPSIICLMIILIFVTQCGAPPHVAFTLFLYPCTHAIGRGWYDWRYCVVH